MKTASIVSLLILLFIFSSSAIIISCSDDDDDDDNNDDSSTDGLCFIQCEDGCLVGSACTSAFEDEAACAQWGQQQCEVEGCAYVQYEVVPDCEFCSECDDAPDWY